MKWIMWNERAPESDEDTQLVLFRNFITGKYWINYGTVVTGMFWYDEEPIAWLPRINVEELKKELNLV